MLCMAGVTAGAQESSRLSFGVISDTHFENNMGDGAMVKVPKALKALTSYGPLDAIAVAGDITDNGNPEFYKMLVSVFGDSQSYTNPVGKLMFMMGNHDNYPGEAAQSNYQEGLKDLNGGELYPLHTYSVIKGYPFITVSMSASGGEGAYPAATREWLNTHLEKAAAECPGKPIFVFTHVPPTYTCYATWADWENGVSWSMNSLNSILNKYPQAVVFAGHSHYPLGDPRSIHQGTNPNSNRQNFYTVINTGSTSYTEIEGVLPTNYQNVSEGLIVTELENGNIEIRRYDTYRNEEIGATDRWVLEAPFDGSMFKYATIYDSDDNPDGRPIRDGLPEPAFFESAELTVEPASYDAKITFPQATDTECVVRYEAIVTMAESGVIVAQGSEYAQYYLNSDMPETITIPVKGLRPEVEYMVEVKAYDSFSNASEPLYATFETVEDNDPANEVPEPYAQWTFDSESNFMGSMGMHLIDGHNLTECSDPAEAGIRSIEGPSEENRAIFIPANAGLKAGLSVSEPTQNYTLQMDIRVPSLGSFNALLQTTLTNSDDTDICINGSGNIGIGTLGYGGQIEPNTWYRVLMVNRDGQFSLYLDGKLLNTASDSRWTIQSEGVLLFTDDDGECRDIEVAEVAFWNVPLTEGQMNRMGNIQLDEYVRVQTPSVRVIDETEFTITVNTNTVINFVLPDWIEAVDAQPVLGSKEYHFRAQPLAEPGERTGTILIESANLPTQEVTVTQIFLGNEIPAATGAWTFDDPADPMKGTGTATLLPAMITLDGPQVTATAEEAGLVPLEEGPTAGNGALGVPVGTCMQLNTNLGDELLADYTIMMDIRPEKLDGYNGLFSNTTDLSRDASFFIKNGAVGRASSGLGYNGMMDLGVWHRIVAVVRGSMMSVYIDGQKVGAATSPNDEWIIHPSSLFFADNDGEEVWTDVAEIRFWDVPLSDAFVSELGKVEQKEILPDPILAPTNVWTFDDTANLLHSDGLAKLVCAVKGEDTKPVDTDDLAAAGMVPVEGPSAENGAITVPIDTYLRIYHNQDVNPQKFFSFMMDIRPKMLGGYQVLYQADPSNQTDGSLCLHNSEIGLNMNGLGYGANLEQDKWHRIIFVSEGCNLAVYVDGIRYIASTSPSVSRWSLNEGSLFFADENGEEGVIDIAELRYWNDVLTPSMVKQLGAVGDGPTGIDTIENPTAPTGTYDLMGRKLNADKLQKGVYIRDGKKVVVK